MVSLWPSLKWLQAFFMHWFNDERRKDIITFPVESFSLLNDGKDFVDKDSAELVAEMYAKGHSFFTYTSDSVDSLSSCCRLRNEVSENTFSYSLGAGGIATGSKCVMTLNMNRFVQDCVKNGDNITEAVYRQAKKMHKYLNAFNEILKDLFAKHMLPVYEAGYISLEKQYLTIGINGVNEAAEFMGIKVCDSEEYTKFLESILEPIYRADKEDKTDELMFNMEFVPKMCGHVKSPLIDLEFPLG